LTMPLDYFQHRSDVVLGDGLRHATGSRVAITRKRPDCSRQSRALFVSLAGHDCSDGTAKRPPFDAVVTKTLTHDEGPQVRIAESERAENMRVLRNFSDRITRVIDNDFLRRDEDAHRRLESLDIKVALRSLKLHQIQRSQIARCVIKEEILRARV